MPTPPRPHEVLPPGYRLRTMEQADHPRISEICARVYTTERPYTDEELATHHAVFPEGQIVAVHEATGEIAGVHFTLVLELEDFHVDDPWDVLTAQGLFTDHDPNGHTLYGADLMVHPDHQHHGLARGLTLATRELTRALRLWRMVGASRMPHYGRYLETLSPEDYVAAVIAERLTDPVLTAHLHDGWEIVMPIRGYLPHDVESAGWAAVIQWLNPETPPPPGFDLRKLPRRETPAGG